MPPPVGVPMQQVNGSNDDFQGTKQFTVASGLATLASHSI